MIGFQVTFEAGRYHATPWKAHANEGTIEWPPSPWRILRALIAGSYRLPDDQQKAARPVIEKLSKTLPVFRLPKTSSSHVRHYFPVGKTTTNVIDAFLVFGTDNTMDVGWEVSLSESEKDTFESILNQVTYLGRSESWVSLKPIEEITGVLSGPTSLFDSNDTVRLLAPIPDSNAWENLTRTTTTIRGERWNNPPGSRWITYEVNEEKAQLPVRERPKDFVFSFVGKRLPKEDDVVRVSEKLRAAIFHSYKDQEVPPIFMGKDENGDPLKGMAHSHFLPIIKNHEITGIRVHCPIGFGPEEMKVLSRRYRIFSGKTQDTLVPTPVSELGIGKSSKIWVSSTPFVPAIRSRTVEDQVKYLLKQNFGVVPTHVSYHVWSTQDFRRVKDRRNGLSKLGYQLRVEFDHGVSGPLMVGYGSHFGLGQLKPSRA